MTPLAATVVPDHNLVAQHVEHDSFAHANIFANQSDGQRQDIVCVMSLLH